MSDIVIRGMEMPKEGDTYGLHLVIYPSGEVWIAYDDKPITEAIEIPPHGRLIDADKLLHESGYDPMMFQPKYGGDHRTQYKTLMGYEILGIVDDAPTVLEVSE